MKRILLPLLTMCLMLVFAACGDGKKSGRTTGMQAGPGELSTKAVPVRLMTWRYLPQDAEVINAFQNKYSVKVDVIVRPMRDIVADAVAGKQLQADVLLVPTLEDAARLKGFGALQPFFVEAFTNGDVADRYLVPVLNKQPAIDGALFTSPCA